MQKVNDLQPVGDRSKVYPHSGRGRVEWSLAVGYFENGRLPSHWLNPYKCVSRQPVPPHHNQTMCQCYEWSVSEGERSFLELTQIACPGGSD